MTQQEFEQPEWLLFFWRDHVRLFREILAEGGLEKVSPTKRRVYGTQKKRLLSVGLQSAGKVAYGL